MSNGFPGLQIIFFGVTPLVFMAMMAQVMMLWVMTS
jgi:hypothetical protein